MRSRLYARSAPLARHERSAFELLFMTMALTVRRMRVRLASRVVAKSSHEPMAAAVRRWIMRRTARPAASRSSAYRQSATTADLLRQSAPPPVLRPSTSDVGFEPLSQEMRTRFELHASGPPRPDARGATRSSTSGARTVRSKHCRRA